MNRLLLVFLCCLTCSCKYFEAKKTSSEAILDEELKTFTWNEVDEYPVFASCDSTLVKADREACFENTLIDHISQRLYQNNMVVTCDVSDTVYVRFNISSEGKLDITETEIDSFLISEIPEIESYLYQSVDSLPKIYPAIKRGQQVTTEFTLPLIVEVLEE